MDEIATRLTTLRLNRHDENTLRQHPVQDNRRRNQRHAIPIGQLQEMPRPLRSPGCIRHAEGGAAQTTKVKLAMAVEQDPTKRSLYATALQSSPPPNPNSDSSANANTLPVWADRKILLSRGLELEDSRRHAVEISIRRAGGRVLPFPSSASEEELGVDACDVFVTRYREGRAYVRAYRAGKTVGTLAWVYHCQSVGAVTRPLDQLLHFPLPRGGIPGFMGHVRGFLLSLFF